MTNKLTKKLTKNRWKCLYCNDIIESKHQHHFVTCKCGKTSVDGGTEYIRLIGDLSMIEYVDSDGEFSAFNTFRDVLDEYSEHS